MIVEYKGDSKIVLGYCNGGHAEGDGGMRCDELGD